MTPDERRYLRQAFNAFLDQYRKFTTRAAWCFENLDDPGTEELLERTDRSALRFGEMGDELAAYCEVPAGLLVRLVERIVAL